MDACHFAVILKNYVKLVLPFDFRFHSSYIHKTAVCLHYRCRICHSMKKFSHLRTKTKLESDEGVLENNYEKNFQMIHRHSKSATHQRYLQDMMSISTELAGKSSVISMNQFWNGKNSRPHGIIQILYLRFSPENQTV